MSLRTVSLTDRHIEVLHWLDRCDDGISPIIDDVDESKQVILGELVAIGLVAELRNERRWGGDGACVAWRILQNPTWAP